MRVNFYEKFRFDGEERVIFGCGVCVGLVCVLYLVVFIFCFFGIWIFRVFFMMGWGLSFFFEKRCFRGLKVSWLGMFDRVKLVGSGLKVISIFTVFGFIGLGVFREVRFWGNRMCYTRVYLFGGGGFLRLVFV